MRLLPDDAYQQIMEALEFVPQAVGVQDSYMDDYTKAKIDSYQRAVKVLEPILDLLRSMEPVEPVLYQWRWLNPAGSYGPESMTAWKEVNLRNTYTDTIEGRIAELEAYRYEGKKVYEVRPLYAAKGTT